MPNIIMETFKLIVKVHMVRTREVIGWSPKYIEDDDESDSDEEDHSIHNCNSHDVPTNGYDQVEVETIYDESPVMFAHNKESVARDNRK